MPSRRFLIQQSVLNAALVYEPEIAKILGVNRTLRGYCTPDWTYCRDSFVKMVRICYRDLCAEYGEAV